MPAPPKADLRRIPQGGLLFLGAGGVAYLLGGGLLAPLEKRALGLKGRVPHLAFWKSRTLRARPPLPGG